MTRTWLLLVGLLCSAAALTAQAPPRPPTVPDDVSISGRVVDGVTGRPIAGAKVQAGSAYDFRSGGGPGGFYTIGPNAMDTDAEGRFTFSNLPSGPLRLVASKAGYPDGYLGTLGANDEYPTISFQATSAQKFMNMEIKMWAQATIAGVVEDDVHDPIVGATVELLRKAHAGPQVTWSRAPLSSPKTDDRGRYRFTNIPPGQYLVVAPRPAANASRPEPSHPPVFYPDTLDVRTAMPLRVSSGDALESINLTLRSVVAEKPVSLSGRLVGPADRIGGRTVRLVPADTADAMVDYQANAVTTGADGGFKVSGLAQGQYRLIVCDLPNMSGHGDIPTVRMLSLSGGSIPFRAPYDENPKPFAKLPDIPTLVADLPVDLSANVDDLQVVLRTAARIRGKVIFDFAGPPPAEALLLSSVVMVTPAFGLQLGPMPLSRVEMDGSFASIGLPPGSYGVSSILRMSSLAAPQVISSIRVNGAERLGLPIELGDKDITDVVLTLTDKKTTVAGTVVDGTGQPTAAARVFLFPRDVDQRPNLAGMAARRTFPVTVDPSGHFTTSVPPGDYLMAAVSALPVDWQDAGFLASLEPLATRVQIAAGESRTAELRVRPLPKQ